MGRGSKIYHRFGLKWALAYRCKKLKRKIKNNTPLCLQKALMFFKILKLKNTNKFQIYTMLTQCHCIIEKQKHLEFIAKHYEEIHSWLNSQEFKEKYVKTNHPYPPLLNPERLNAKVESCKDNKLSALSLQGTNKVRDETIHNVAYFKDSIAESKIDKIMDCNKAKASRNDEATESHKDKFKNPTNPMNPITPYPNLSYESIPPELAWDLNLPLPRGYDCIWALFGLSGCTAFGSFLEKLGTSMLYMGASFDKAYKKAYLYLRERSLNLLVWVNFDDRKELHRKKLFSLMDSKVPLLMNVRDSVGRLKHGVNHGSFKTQKTQYSIDDPMELLVDRVTYGGQDEPHLVILGNFSNENVFCGSPEIWIYDKVVQMLPNAKYVKYLDMQEIVGERTFDAMMKLAKEFGFPLPQEKDREFFTSKINNQYRYLLPITIYINKKIQVFVQQQIYSPQDKIDILPKLSLDSLGLQIGFFVSKEEEIELLSDKSLCKSVSEKLQEYIKLLKAKTISIEANKVTESQVLEYFKENPQIRKVYKGYFDKEFTHLKANRPDIVESWKYYQEFERMCKELD